MSSGQAARASEGGRGGRPQGRRGGGFGPVVMVLGALVVVVVVGLVLSGGTGGAGGHATQGGSSGSVGGSGAGAVGQVGASEATAAAAGRVAAPQSGPAGATSAVEGGADRGMGRGSYRGAERGSSGALPQRRIRVGAWNIEWFGKAGERSGFSRGVAQRPELVAQYILDSKAAVVGLAEIVTEMPGRPIRSGEMEAVVERLGERGGQQWDYVLHPGRQSGDQLTGMMWNRAVVTALGEGGRPWDSSRDVAWRVPVRDGRGPQGSRLWHRPPYAMKFTAGAGLSDFVVIMVHMKADFQGDFAVHRRMEMEALVEAVPSVRRQFGDSDIIIIGDMNTTNAAEEKFEVARGAGLVDLNAAGIVTTWRGGITDRAMVPSDQPEFKGSEFWVMSDVWLRGQRWSAGDFKRELSDHYMVGLELRVMEDDD